MRTHMTKAELIKLLRKTKNDEPVILQLPFAPPPVGIGRLKYVGTARYEANEHRAAELGIELGATYTLLDFEEIPKEIN